MSIRPLPGRPIPYTFTPEEVLAFINDRHHENDLDLQTFLESLEPPWGVTIHGMKGNIAGEFVVWQDETGRLQVVDVTGHPIAREVERIPYHTTDESLIRDLLERIKALTDQGLGGLGELAELAPLALVVIGVALVVRG